VLVTLLPSPHVGEEEAPDFSGLSFYQLLQPQQLAALSHVQKPAPENMMDLKIVRLMDKSMTAPTTTRM
jgi:hypothetical protein